VSNGCPIYGRAREWTPLDARLACPALRLSWSVHHRSQTRWHSVDLALAFRSGVRALAMSESHVRKVIDSAAVLWSIRLRIWGSGVRISPGAPITYSDNSRFCSDSGACFHEAARWKQCGSVRGWMTDRGTMTGVRFRDPPANKAVRRARGVAPPNVRSAADGHCTRVTTCGMTKTTTFRRICWPSASGPSPIWTGHRPLGRHSHRDVTNM
jgi:hypothetical protein